MDDAVEDVRHLCFQLAVADLKRNANPLNPLAVHMKHVRRPIHCDTVFTVQKDNLPSARRVSTAVSWFIVE